ncbi:pimeloyl-ACP methyl ester carboxylesterase [Asanoa ferruginea]|uniref:Pimeloyl-ACP methyl ester carboxylesterase n=1 Tax=Asanoa ferruginea TaxID=53367 RepID=A0A3D9ZQP7_9ACTN|nr:alpha/beta hydrolase [Asanoa ferruginea]REF99686.1 pimeloyl-ACP methyl ester carboxylesterase [Asanoa ferruginea]GIF50395.1 alpha/beta hydrolase [Asanoa ferruginea]
MDKSRSSSGVRAGSPWWRHLLQLIVVATLMSLSLAATGAAPAAAGGGYPSAKPTIVLVHGAWADGSSWNGVTQRLLNEGFVVRVPPNPLRSLPGDSETIADFLSTIRGPIILAGHSYGGAVITNAARGNRNVKALVFVDAFAPAQGENVFQLSGPDSALSGDPAQTFDFVPYPNSPPGDVDLYIKKNVFLQSFTNFVPRPTANILYTIQHPFAFSAGGQSSGPPAWQNIRSWWVLGTQDKIIPPAQQLFMANRAHAKITQVRAGHLSLVTRPDVVAGVILQAVHSTT